VSKDFDDALERWRTLHSRLEGGMGDLVLGQTSGKGRYATRVTDVAVHGQRRTRMPTRQAARP